MLKKYYNGALNFVYNIYIGDKSWIIQDESNPTEVVRAGCTANQMVACSFLFAENWYTIICFPEAFCVIRKSRNFSLPGKRSSHTYFVFLFLHIKDIRIARHFRRLKQAVDVEWKKDNWLKRMQNCSDQH